ncbi:hypothetical protein HPB47_015570 [Ixodes persulcatus]|uniref:Uncharacterized protein n=1 Tax=Ixodes persulcatus TaxID=34615 RepID=A0AC60QT57_IXOPE|nr:hypothetical protein HPB47_015570 [Ixodes persulcatus]
MIHEAGSAAPPSDASSMSDDSSIIMSDPDDNAGFTLVKSKRIRKRKHVSKESASSDDTIITTPSPGLTVVVKPADPSQIITKVNPLKLSEKLNDIAPDGVILIRPNYRLNLLAIDTRNTESKKTLLKMTTLCGMKITVYEAHQRSSAIGIIRGVSQEITEADLQVGILATVPVTQVRRLGKSDIVKLAFATETAPEYVTLGHTRFKILPYTDKPRQCPKCSRFGHVASVCNKVERCSRCGGNHQRSACEAKEPQCINCKKDHESTSRQCTFYKTEKKISAYCSENNVNYTAARSVVKPSGPRHQDPEQRSHHRQSNETEKASQVVVIPPARDADFPPLPSHSTDGTNSVQTSPGSSHGQHQESVSQSKKLQWAPKQPHNECKAPPLLRSSETPKSQSLGNTLHTIATLLRNLLVSLDSPLAQATITIIDIALPLISSWCR